MATCSFIRETKQTAGSMAGIIRYVSQDKKTLGADGRRYLTGVNCPTELAQQAFMATKNLYGKASGAFFYQYVQSFSPQEDVTPAEAHEIALELAERFFPGCEVLVATHSDAAHLHSHFVVNSVHPDTGKKLRFTPKTLEQMRQVSDRICEAHGLTTLTPYQQDRKTAGLRTGEYRAAVRGESWKFQLINAIETAMTRASSREDFIREMRRRGYEVRWEAGRKSITYTTPTGMKCRDDKLHERKFRKEQMEHEFRIRQRAAQQRIIQLKAAGTGAPDDDRPAAQRPLYDAHADGGTAGGGAPENAGIAGEYPHIHGDTCHQGEPGAHGDLGGAAGLGESDTGAQPGDISVHGGSPARDEGREPTDWEETRRIYWKAIQNGGRFPKELGWEDAGVREEQSQNHPEFGGDIDARQCPAVDAAAVANDILRLLSQLEGGVSEQTIDSTTRHYHGDRKRRSREREKKISMGHRADDHEEQGQKMM